MLLLRATVGITVAAQGGVSLAVCGAGTPGILGTSLLEVTMGAFLFIGLLTPIAGFLVGFASMGIAFSWIPAPMLILSDSWLSTFFVVIMAAAIGLLGPGAFSVDSCLFGRREIIIPPPLHSRKS
jgi:uncharacterized membrane protein YphA (DoxX/SURF4 family)